MNLKPKAALGYLVGWVFIIAFVVLLSLIFSFLGTIICAAVAGMMMGATRMPRVASAAVSLIFPAVIIGVLRLSHAELEDRQIIFLGILCFALYWMIYAALFRLVPQEQVSRGKPKQQKSPVDALAVSSAEEAEPATMSRRQVSGFSRPSENKGGHVTLETLQGTWVARSESADGERTLVIKQEKLLMMKRDGRGGAQALAAATLQVVSSGSVLALRTPDCAALCDIEEQVSI